MIGHPRILRFGSRLLITSLLLASFLSISAYQKVHATETTTYFPRISEIYPNTPSDSIDCVQHPDCEFVELYNPSEESIELSRYSLAIKGNTATPRQVQGSLSAGSYAVTSVIALRNSGATVQLINNDTQQVIEEVSYDDSTTTTQINYEVMSWSYFSEGWELTPITKGAPNIHFPAEEPEPVDICLATPAIDSTVPTGYRIDENGGCVPVIEARGKCYIEISEISAQPNFDGKEYIEFFNPSDKVALLEQCKIKINGGAEKDISTVELAPQSLYLMPFSSGAIRNTSGTITLINSDNVESEYAYQDTSSGEVNNFITGSLAGVVSNHPTPSATNITADSNSETVQPSTLAKTVSSGASAVTPCAPGKFRNLETNRCKNIASTTSSVLSCAVDQIRNPVTNRCKKATTASASLTPCQPGQVRNPTTNRCKKSTTVTSDLKPCAENQERNLETNRCRKVATDVSGTVLGAAADPASVANSSYKLPAAIISVTALFGYALYEYRSDISRRFTSFREKRRSLRPPD